MLLGEAAFICIGEIHWSYRWKFNVTLAANGKAASVSSIVALHPYTRNKQLDAQTISTRDFSRGYRFDLVPE
jgi:hypothetical protein